MNSKNRERFVKRKPYHSPEIIHEFELETRAGSPLGEIENLSIDDVIIGVPNPNDNLFSGESDKK